VRRRLVGFDMRGSAIFLAVLGLILVPTGVLGGHGPPAPTVGSVIPSCGPVEGGTPVTVIGNNFPPLSRVVFGGVEARSVVVVAHDRITAVTPSHAAGCVAVAVGSGVRGFSFTYVEANGRCRQGSIRAAQ